MIIFTWPAYKHLTSALLKKPGNHLGLFNVSRYENDELYLTLKTKVKNEICLIIGATAPPDVNFLELLMLASTLRQEGAKKIIALVPYLGYSRQEHLLKNMTRTAYLFGHLLKTAGVDDLITIDLHNPLITKDFPIKLINLSTRPIFEPVLKKLANKNITLLAPDQGALKRCQDLQIGWPIAYLEKKRLAKTIKIYDLKGALTSEVVICDDILGTGATLVKAVKKLRQLGVTKITILVTHGQFRTNIWRQLLRQPVDKIYVSDTCPEAKNYKNNKIKILSSLPTIKCYFDF